MARKTWRCFHCDEVFYSERQAAIHFGNAEYDHPACKLAHHEGPLIDYIRKLETELAQYRDESHALLIAAYSLNMTTRGLAVEAEQRGYDKGVSDVYAMIPGSAEDGGPK